MWFPNTEVPQAAVKAFANGRFNWKSSKAMPVGTEGSDSQLLPGHGTQQVAAAW